MRDKDEQKFINISNAVLELTNKVGLSGLSISKISKKANVSPATIYIYFENKEDLINKVYLNVKRDIGKNIFTNIDDNEPLNINYKEILKEFSIYIQENQQAFLFVEQLQNSPIISQDILSESEDIFQPMYMIFTKGIENGIVKDIAPFILKLLTFNPLMEYIKNSIINEKKINNEEVNQIINMSWRAITN